MKPVKLFLFFATMVWSVTPVRSQGTIEFHNWAVATVVTHVYAPSTCDRFAQIVGNGTNDYPAGTATYPCCPLIGASGTGGPYGAATTFTQLLVAPGTDQPYSSLVPASPVTTFRTGRAAGWISPTTSTPNNVAPDAPSASVVMVAWDNSSGLYPTWTQAQAAWLSGAIAAGESNPINVFPVGGNFNPPPFLLGLQSFNMYFTPEPSTLTLVGLGAATLLLRRRLIR
jgi:hypothetical protein